MEREFRALLLAGLPGMTASQINWGQHSSGRPYVVLHLIDLNEGMTQQGPDGLQSARVQVDCYALEYGQANEIGRAVKVLLNGHRGGGFRGIIFAGMRTLRETGDTPGDALYRASLDFMTHWRDDDA